MPNDLRIDDIVSDKALKSVKDLEAALERAQGQLASSVSVVNKFNDALLNSKGAKEFAKAQADIATATDKVNKNQDDTIKKAQQVDAAMDALSTKEVARLKKEQDAIAKRSAIVKASTDADYAAYEKSQKGVQGLTTVVNDYDKAAAKAANDAIAFSSAVADTGTATESASNAQKEFNAGISVADGLIDKNVKSLIQLKLQSSNVSTAQKDLKKQFEAGTISEQQFISKTSELEKDQIGLKSAIQQTTQSIKQVISAQTVTNGSYDDLNARLNRSRAAYNALNKEERDNVNIGGALLGNIKALDTELKEIDATQGKFGRDVGNYGKALDGLPGPIGSAIGSFKALFTTLLANPIGIAAAALYGLYETFKLNDDAANKLAGTMLAFKTIVSNAGNEFTVFAKSAADNKYLSTVFDVAKTSIFTFIPGLKAAKDGYDLLYEANKDVIETSIAYEVELDNIEQAQSNFNKTIAQNNLEIQRQSTLAKTTSLDAKDRIAALDKESSLMASSVTGQIAIIDQQIAAEKKLLAVQGQAEDQSKQREATTFRINDLEVKRIEQLTAQEALETSNEKRRSALLKEIAAEEKKRIDDEFALAKQRLEIQRDTLQKVADSETESINVRLAAQTAAGEKETAIIKLTKAHDLQEIDISDTKEKTIREKADDDSLNATQKTATQRSKIVIGELDKQLNAFNKDLSDQQKVRTAMSAKELNQLETARDTEIAALNSKDEDYQNKKLAIQEKYAKIYIQKEIDNVNAVIEANAISVEQIESYEKQLAEYKINYSNAATDAERQAVAAQIQLEQQKLEDAKKQITDADELRKKSAALQVQLNEVGLKDDKKTNDEKKKQIQAYTQASAQLTQEAFNFIGSLANSSYVRQQNQIQATSDANDAAYAKQKANIEASTDDQATKDQKLALLDQKKAQQDAALAEKAKKAQLEKAKRDRAIQIGQIIAQTALAVVTQLDAGPPLGFALAAAAAAIGALQLATVIATPLPTYEHGGTHPSDGPAIFGEKGVELRQDPDGSVSFTPDKPTIGFVKKGTKFTSHHKLKQMMAMGTLGDYINNSSRVDMDVKSLMENDNRNAKMLSNGFRRNDPIVKQTGGVRQYKTRA